MSCFAVEIKAKTKGFEPKEGGSELVDLPKKEDVALFLHTSGTTSRPKVCTAATLCNRHTHFMAVSQTHAQIHTVRYIHIMAVSQTQAQTHTTCRCI